jgi:hypothetical protein
MFGLGEAPTVAGQYVADRIWPQISRDRPDLSASQSRDECFAGSTPGDFRH